MSENEAALSGAAAEATATEPAASTEELRIMQLKGWSGYGNLGDAGTKAPSHN
jgi:hypothetical protein